MMTIETFGAALLRTGDLDPAYVAIHGAALPEPMLHRLLLSYWCFYSLDTATRLAVITSPSKFWAKMHEAAVNAGEPKPWPRGAERRHFRGDQAVFAVNELATRYKTPTDAVMGLVGMPTQKAGKYFGLPMAMTYNSVAKSAQSHRGFGEWIAFKIADMAERVMGLPVDFSDCHLGIYKDPRQGAAVAYQEWSNKGQQATPLWSYPITDEELELTVAEGVRVFKKFKAPPARDRVVNVQEVETIFCKYKSHLKGHYPLGKDTLEIRHGLENSNDLGQLLRANLPSYDWTATREAFA